MQFVAQKSGHCLFFLSSSGGMLERRAFAGRRKWRHPLFGAGNCMTSYLHHIIMLIKNRNKAVFFYFFALISNYEFSLSSLRLSLFPSVCVYKTACQWAYVSVHAIDTSDRWNWRSLFFWLAMIQEMIMVSSMIATAIRKVVW